MLGTIIGATVTVLVQLAVAIFIYGKLTERVNTHTEDIKGLKSTTQKHEGEIGELYGHAGLRR
jgi:hypothetical protein